MVEKILKCAKCGNSKCNSFFGSMSGRLLCTKCYKGKFKTISQAWKHEIQEKYKNTKEIKTTNFKPKNPSKENNSYWVTAESNKKYPKSTERNGKWMLFVYLKDLDKMWEIIKKATKKGILGSSSKAGTAKENPNALNPELRVICIYTYDSEDKEDVARIAWELYKLGVIKTNLIYKTDESTERNLYAKDGYKNISKYTTSAKQFEGLNKKQFIEFFKEKYK